MLNQVKMPSTVRLTLSRCTVLAVGDSLPQQLVLILLGDEQQTKKCQVRETNTANKNEYCREERTLQRQTAALACGNKIRVRITGNTQLCFIYLCCLKTKVGKLLIYICFSCILTELLTRVIIMETVHNLSYYCDLWQLFYIFMFLVH